MQRQIHSSYDSSRRRDAGLSDVLEGAESLDELAAVESTNGKDGTSVRLSDDDIFEVLYNRRRRDVIRYLREQGGASTVSDLAEHIAAKENDITVQQLSSYERKRVYVGLYQNHLPMMDKTGVVEYDDNRGTVRLRETVKQLEPYLGDVGATDRSRAVIGSAALLAAVVLLGVLDVGTFAAMPDPMWLVFGAVGLLGLTVFDAYDRIA